MTENQTIKDADFTQEKMDDEYFNCIFQHCNFMEIRFPKMVFEKCRFVSCNLSLCKTNHTSWMKVAFDNCKMTGMQFISSNKFTFNVEFLKCALQYASFQELTMHGTKFEDCLLTEVDFTGCDLKKSDFSHSDLNRSQFFRTNLEESDFSTAQNYVINPNENRIAGAKFSFQGISGLLNSFNIEIV